jgi:hypothetical protein
MPRGAKRGSVSLAWETACHGYNGEVGVNWTLRGLRHVALSISLLSPITRRPETLLAMNIASLIFRADRGFLALTSFQSFKRPSLSFGSSSRISLRRQPFSVSRPRLRPPGNIHNRSRLLLTNKTHPRFAAMSFDLCHCHSDPPCHRTFA